MTTMELHRELFERNDALSVLYRGACVGRSLDARLLTLRLRCNRLGPNFVIRARVRVKASEVSWLSPSVVDMCVLLSNTLIIVST